MSVEAARDEAVGAGLYLTEAATARRLGVSDETWRAARAVLERQGLPPRDPIFCNRRFWPAVEAFLLRRYGIGTLPGLHPPDGEEDLDAF